MLRINRLYDGSQDVKTYLLRDIDRRCSCGRCPAVTISISGLEQLMNDTDARRRYMLRARWEVAHATIRQLPPCDHGAVERAIRRHHRRTYRRYWL